MDLPVWAELSAAISDVRQRIPADRRDTHDTARVVRAHLWSVLHDRPTVWACDPLNWTDATRPGSPPDQTRMTRRTRRDDLGDFMGRVTGRLARRARDCLAKLVDGKPLEPSANTTDAAWGRRVSRSAKGYERHAIHADGNDLPVAFEATPLDVCEKRVAARPVERAGGGGHVLGDSHDDASWPFDHCAAHGHRLVCPRPRPGTGLGYHSGAQSKGMPPTGSGRSTCWSHRPA